MRLGQVETAHSVVEWMRRSGVPPNVITYTALLTLPRRIADADRGSLLAAARAAHAALRDAGVPPNARFFTAYLGVCGRVRGLAAAQEAWAGLGEAGVEPDLYLYSAMIDVCAKVGCLWASWAACVRMALVCLAGQPGEGLWSRCGVTLCWRERKGEEKR